MWPRKKNKFGAKKTVVDDITFHSKGESLRYLDLKLLERAGTIQNLQRQVPYKLVVNDILIAKYVSDFVYEENGKSVTEDFKGVLTEAYRLKKKLMLACYGITIFETGKK